ncbi:cell division protein ZipA [Shewanella japonica]|uniref:Cell division protein ZipA n=1 Tax=Shewanella japonica TaxID=93973 RepID=A0ABN4YEM2_9GAMM|nr:cell division protein ZipA [Shewanella japonica]ARD22907.1 cell division protein ZipA [Shewanella japonica]
MEDFQLVLFVLGAIAIIAVLVHGFWSIRKQQPKSLKDNPMTGFYKDQAQQRDSQGFDADGIGEVRRVKVDSDTSEGAKVEPSPIPTPSGHQPDNNDVEINEVGSKKGIGLQNQSAVNTQAPSYHPERKEPVLKVSEPVQETIAEIQPAVEEHVPTQQALFAEDSYSQPQSNQVETMTTADVEPAESKQDASVAQAAVNETVKPTLQETTSQDAVIDTAEPEEPLGEPQDVLVLHVVAREGEQMHGAELLPSLLSLNFKFGDMDIFHRHLDNAGNGKVLFSMANMLKPGVFDPDNMEQFVTQGVVLFMTLPCHGDPLMNFSIMLNSAQQLADDLGAEVLDGQRQPWTDSTKQEYLGRIRVVA